MTVHRLIRRLAIACLLAATSAQAAIIDHALITPSTDLTADTRFPIEQIVDGITSDAAPFNGFAAAFTAPITGTIRFDFSQPFDLSGFLLYNDINVLREGIRNFTLTLFDNAGTAIATSFPTTYVGPISQAAAEEYLFAAPVRDVASAELFVVDTNVGGATRRIEIREVEFSLAAPAIAVPAPGALALLMAGLFAVWRRIQA